MIAQGEQRLLITKIGGVLSSEKKDSFWHKFRGGGSETITTLIQYVLPNPRPSPHDAPSPFYTCNRYQVALASGTFGLISLQLLDDMGVSPITGLG